MAYTTGAEVKLEVDTPMTEADIDTYIIPEAETVINSYVTRDFYLHASGGEILDGDDDNYLFLEGYPLIAVHSVKVRGALIDPSRYFIRYNAVVLYYGNWRMSYGGGWSSTLNSGYVNENYYGAGQFGISGLQRGSGIIEVVYTYGYTAV